MNDPAPATKSKYRQHAVLTLLLYLAGLALCMIAGVTQTVNASGRPTGAAFDPWKDFSIFAVITALAGLFAMLAAVVAYAINLGRMWSLVQDGRASLSPAVATAIGVIPGVHLVGSFFAFYGLAKEINRVGAARGVPKVSELCALAACICLVVSLASCIPLIGGCIGGPPGLAAMVLWFVSMFDMARAATQLEQGVPAAPTAPG